MSKVGSSTQCADDPSCFTLCRRRGNLSAIRPCRVSRTRAKSSGLSKMKIPVTIMRFVGSSMCSQAVSTYVSGVPS